MPTIRDPVDTKRCPVCHQFRPIAEASAGKPSPACDVCREQYGQLAGSVVTLESPASDVPSYPSYALRSDGATIHFAGCLIGTHGMIVLVGVYPPGRYHHNACTVFLRHVSRVWVTNVKERNRVRSLRRFEQRRAKAMRSAPAAPKRIEDKQAHTHPETERDHHP